ncbi:hypothetical protein TgHK011_005661 [Trichoderma gracile]|nr:hypothetical protein TgHK011_005661 [Trichoderma gracile]
MGLRRRAGLGQHPREGRRGSSSTASPSCCSAHQAQPPQYTVGSSSSTVTGVSSAYRLLAHLRPSPLPPLHIKLSPKPRSATSGQCSFSHSPAQGVTGTYERGCSWALLCLAQQSLPTQDGSTTASQIRSKGPSRRSTGTSPEYI